MYKTELIRCVAKETRLSQSAVHAALTASLRQIAAALAAGEPVTLPGFGTFYPSRHQAGRIRDVRTGKLITVPARRTAAFRAGAILKRAVAAPPAKS
ncbi:MAG TPA: HU family DNA-binding protein, partial [Thermomicrobiales bacterium]|nr:HU family DNA-binding protein [Thermomicrobiales bacterium]